MARSTENQWECLEYSINDAKTVVIHMGQKRKLNHYFTSYTNQRPIVGKTTTTTTTQLIAL